MARNDGRIEKGQPLRTAISARAWNRAQEAADRVLGSQPGTTGEGVTVSGGASNIVYVHNISGFDVPIGGCLSLELLGGQIANGTFTGDDEGSKYLRAMFQTPNYVGKVPASNSHVGIPIEPIPNGKVGRVAVRGAVYFRCRVGNVLHGYARPLAGDVTQLTSGGCGPVKLFWAGGQGQTKNAFGVM